MLPAALDGSWAGVVLGLGALAAVGLAAPRWLAANLLALLVLAGLPALCVAGDPAFEQALAREVGPWGASARLLGERLLGLAPAAALALGLAVRGIGARAEVEQAAARERLRRRCETDRSRRLAAIARDDADRQAARTRRTSRRLRPASAQATLAA